MPFRPSFLSIPIWRFAILPSDAAERRRSIWNLRFPWQNGIRCFRLRLISANIWSRCFICPLFPENMPLSFRKSVACRYRISLLCRNGRRSFPSRRMNGRSRSANGSVKLRSLRQEDFATEKLPKCCIFQRVRSRII